MTSSYPVHRHAALTNRMAQRLGIDPATEISEGRLSRGEWHRAVMRCTGCKDPGACLVWLFAKPEGCVRAAAPDYCENRLMLARLRAKGMAARAV